MTKHVDVRGPWPVFVDGMRAVSLTPLDGADGKQITAPRDISVEAAEMWAEEIEAAKGEPFTVTRKDLGA